MGSESVVDYDNLVNTSFTDSNLSIRSSVRPRWERKLQQQQQQNPQRRALSTSSFNGAGAPGADRFIPNRAGMNMKLSQHNLRDLADCSTHSSTTSASDSHPEGEKYENQKVVSDANKGAYSSQLSAALLGVEDTSNSRIMSFAEKAPAPKGDTVNNLNILYSVVLLKYYLNVIDFLLKFKKAKSHRMDFGIIQLYNQMILCF